jgi:hypothetical protein
MLMSTDPAFSKFSMMIDVLVGTPARFREILGPLLDGADVRLEGIALKETVGAVVNAFEQQLDWANLSESERMTRMRNISHRLSASSRASDRLAGGVLAWALVNRSNGRRRPTPLRNRAVSVKDS